jgi:hypothetical protein
MTDLETFDIENYIYGLFKDLIKWTNLFIILNYITFMPFY